MSISGPGIGNRLRAGGNDITVKAHPDDGAVDLSMFESMVPPGGRVLPHLHHEFEEAFYVLDGQLTFLVGEAWTVAEAGTAVHITRETVHAFRNDSGLPAKVLVIHTPARAIRMIEEMAALPADAGPAASVAVLTRHASEPARSLAADSLRPDG